MITCLMALVLGAITCDARVYRPCELAHFFRYYYSSYIPEKYVPLAVCIAGYHNYSKSNELIHPDGRIFVGYFGLIPEPECPEDRLKDDSYFSFDWNCLKSQVLDVPEKFKLYEKLCGAKLVKKLPCRFNEYYEFGEVLDPIHKDILSLSYGDEKIIDKILASYSAEDQQLKIPVAASKVDKNKTALNPVLATSRETSGTATTESQHVNNPEYPESTNDMTRSNYIQEYTGKHTVLPESRHFDQEDDKFCFTSTQISLICTLLLVQTLLITALFYVLTRHWTNRKSYCPAPELRIPLPSSPPMEEYSRKPHSRVLS